MDSSDDESSLQDRSHQQHFFPPSPTPSSSRQTDTSIPSAIISPYLIPSLQIFSELSGYLPIYQFNPAILQNSPSSLSPIQVGQPIQSFASIQPGPLLANSTVSLTTSPILSQGHQAPLSTTTSSVSPSVNSSPMHSVASFLSGGGVANLPTTPLSLPPRTPISSSSTSLHPQYHHPSNTMQLPPLPLNQMQFLASLSQQQQHHPGTNPFSSLANYNPAHFFNAASLLKPHTRPQQPPLSALSPTTSTGHPGFPYLPPNYLTTFYQQQSMMAACSAGRIGLNSGRTAQAVNVSGSDTPSVHNMPNISSPPSGSIPMSLTQRIIQPPGSLSKPSLSRGSGHPSTSSSGNVGLGERYPLPLVGEHPGNLMDPIRTRLDQLMGSGLTGEGFQPSSSFRKGSLIQLTNGDQRRVEDLNPDDFFSSISSNHPDQRVVASLIIRIDKNLAEGKARIQLKVGPTDKIRIFETNLADPLFELDRGWSSCDPGRTLDLYSLECRALETNDQCLIRVQSSRRASRHIQQTDQVKTSPGQPRLPRHGPITSTEQTGIPPFFNPTLSGPHSGLSTPANTTKHSPQSPVISHRRSPACKVIGSCIFDGSASTSLYHPYQRSPSASRSGHHKSERSLSPQIGVSTSFSLSKIPPKGQVGSSSSSKPSSHNSPTSNPSR